MKSTLILLAALIFSGISSGADPVAVFDVQWGKGKQRQSRSFAIAFFDASAPQTAANFKKLVKDSYWDGWSGIYLESRDPAKACARRCRHGTVAGQHQPNASIEW